MRIKITSGTVIHGIGAVKVGSEHEVDERTARILFSINRAVPCADKPKKPMTRKPKTVKK